MIITILVFIIFAVIIYKLACNSIKKKQSTISKNPSNFGVYVTLWSILSSCIIFIAGSFGYEFLLKNYIISSYIKGGDEYINNFIFYQVLKVAEIIRSGVNVNDIAIYSNYDRNLIINMAIDYNHYTSISYYSLGMFCIAVSLILAFVIIKNFNINTNFQKKIEKIIEKILLLFATIAILTTFAIMISLLVEAIKFFKEISIFKFLFGTKWYPEQSTTDPNNSFGVIPLITGTFLIAFISIITATVIGVSTAIYTSEYMSRRMRKIVKPALEILAGIPSIVYGFFAAVVFSPIIVAIFNFFNIHVVSENALSAGIVMGIMIVPFISSITDDVLSSISPTLRHGAIALGSMHYETILKVLVPAAMPGILSGVLLAISRAIGETMIVVMAASLAANLTINPLEPVTTISAQIVMLVQGDQQFNSPETLAAFALGLVLFLLTLLLNIIALKVVSKYKSKYAQ